MNRRALHADLLLLLAAVIWGFAFVAQRIGMNSVGPFTYTGARFLLGAAALAPAAWVFSPGPLPRIGLPIGLVLFAAVSCQQVGLLTTTVGQAGFITGLYIVLVPLFGYFTGDIPTGRVAVAALLSVIGLYLLSVTAGWRLMPGDGLELSCALLFAVLVILVGRYANRTAPLSLCIAQFAVCGIASTLVAFAVETVTIAGLYGALIPILYGGLLSVGVAYTLQVFAQRDAPPTHAAILMVLESPIAAFGGALILSESLAGRQYAGCVLMLAGMIYSQLGRALEGPQAPDPAHRPP